MTLRASRQEQKERTRLSLVEIATELFASRGISSTATSEIAKALKVSHGTVFLHFPSRDDLVLAVIDDFGSRLSQELKKAVLSESTLKGVLSAHLRALADFEDIYFRILTEMNALPKSIQGTVFMLNAAVSWKLYEAAAPLMKAGKIKRIDQALLFNTWMALVSYYIIHRDRFSNTLPILRENGAAPPVAMRSTKA